MKTKTSKKQSWKTILAVTITAVVSGIVPAFAGPATPITLVNPSFEENSNGGLLGGTEFSFGSIEQPLRGWEPYFGFGDDDEDNDETQNLWDNPNFSAVFTPGVSTDDVFSYGSLEIDTPVDEVFGFPAPDGNRVLLLFTGNGWDAAVDAGLDDGDIDYLDFIAANGIIEYGVQQEAGTLEEGLYVLSYYVGNIATNPDSPLQLTFNGFPGYRVQLLVEDEDSGLLEVIAEDNDMVGVGNKEFGVGEGEFVHNGITASINPDDDRIGSPLWIRLINKNDLIPNQPDSNHREVNFDHINFARVHPPEEEAPVDQSISWIHGSSQKGSSQIERFFSITGKGEKRILLTGRGESLAAGNLELIEDLTVTVLDERGGVVARSDDWSKERDASEISKVLGAERTHRMDAGVVVDLPAGDYSVVVESNGKESGFATFEVYDLDPKSKASLELASADEEEFRRYWR